MKTLRRIAGIVKRQCAKTLRRARLRICHFISQNQLETTLLALTRNRRRVLLVHASLGGCGYIAGGARTVIETGQLLSETLVMPTHTYCYPENVETIGPLCDPKTTPSLAGMITEHFRRLPETVRSIHPTHSLAALGKEAAVLCTGHELCDTPCGRGTPYEKLIELDACVLMFGTSLNTYTLFHTAEDAAECPYLYYPEPYRLRVLNADRRQCEIHMRRQNMSVARRFTEMDTLLEREGLLERRTIGRGELLYLPSSRQVHSFVVDQLRREPFFLVGQSWLANHGTQYVC